MDRTELQVKHQRKITNLVFFVRFCVGVNNRKLVMERLVLLDTFAIPSLRAQTNQDFVVVVMHDASADAGVLLGLERRLEGLPYVLLPAEHTLVRDAAREWTESLIRDQEAAVLLTACLNDDDALHVDGVRWLYEEVDPVLAAVGDGVVGARWGYDVDFRLNRVVQVGLPYVSGVGLARVGHVSRRTGRAGTVLEVPVGAPREYAREQGILFRSVEHGPFFLRSRHRREASYTEREYQVLAHSWRGHPLQESELAQFGLLPEAIARFREIESGWQPARSFFSGVNPPIALTTPRARRSPERAPPGGVEAGSAEGEKNAPAPTLR